MREQLKPELLSPAGDWASLSAAIEGGANSVYFGIKSVNMRHMASNFDVLELKKVMCVLHDRGLSGYLALNIIVMNSDLKKVHEILKHAKEAKVDAVILWDMAVFSIAKELGLKIHLSTQASVANYKAVEMYAKLGVTRVILARECTLVDIKNIRRSIQGSNLLCKIETFIHGAMCLSISGRCFMSKYSHNKSANEGKCIQPCRREYNIKDIDGDSEFIVGKDYVLSPKDVCSIDFIDDLIDAKIDSFKIEGRMRSPEYIREVTAVYREAIDLCFSKAFTENKKIELRNRLNIVYNRGFSSGFYFGEPKKEYSKGMKHLLEKVYVGKVTRFFKKINVAEVCLQSESLSVGDQVLFIGNNTPAKVETIGEMQFDEKFIKQAEKGQTVGIKLSFAVRPRDKVFIQREKKR